mmetsp:Transcript_11200/g.15734  ORF Transcript_11200/g.15734 Transcript_11200/m.15734 type:complete len:360 (-) Transcript_11200:359-1438(-)
MDNPHAPFGFFLVTMAGLSTAVGAGMVFSERMVKMASKRVLAGALSLSAGVMLYVSFAEIFVKSQIGFEDAGFSTSNAYLYASLSFFGGIAFGKTLDVLVHKLDKSHSHDLPDRPEEASTTDIEDSQTSYDQTVDKPSKTNATLPQAVTSPDLTTLNLDKAGKTVAGAGLGSPAGKGSRRGMLTTAGSATSLDTEATDGTHSKEPKDARLVRMGVLTALAIGLHNFPEGLATFVATLDDPSVGGALAVAIAIHNVPEGLCVAIPIYYATGSRAKAFGWALVSGISEPIGAGLGWLVLSAVFSDVLYGVLFGLVAGMMVNICLHELIPTAHRHDPKDTIVSNCLVAGMAIMALSLVLFQY